MRNSPKQRVLGGKNRPFHNRIGNKTHFFYAQFRATEVNFNQVVKELRRNFSEKKAFQMLYKLEKETIKLVELNKKSLN